jgi:hypothetical protein
MCNVIFFLGWGGGGWGRDVQCYLNYLGFDEWKFGQFVVIQQFAYLLFVEETIHNLFLKCVVAK